MACRTLLSDFQLPNVDEGLQKNGPVADLEVVLDTSMHSTP